MLQKKLVQIIKTHFFKFHNFFPEDLVICEIKWKTMLEPDRSHMTIYVVRSSSKVS